jgi:hypothetical protein
MKKKDLRFLQNYIQYKMDDDAPGPLAQAKIQCKAEGPTLGAKLERRGAKRPGGGPFEWPFGKINRNIQTKKINGQRKRVMEKRVKTCESPQSHHGL